MKKEKDTDIAEYDASNRSADFALDLLADKFEGQTFIIEDVEFKEGSLGEYALVTVGSQQYRISSKVILEQLHDIVKLIEAGKRVKVTLKRVKRYYTF